MATVREGSKQALIVVDVQVGVVGAAWERERVVTNIARTVEKARQKDIPIIWVQHSEEELPHGSPAWQWVPELQPADDEIRIDKNFNSSFEQTNLEATLADLGVTHVVLAGAATNWCIRATAYGALERGYDLTLIKDGHTTESMEFEDGRVIDAADIVRELNVGIRWVSYPDRVNTTVSADEIFP